MKIGTRSILFGVHQFAIHPLFVAVAWWKLYGFPFDPRLWFCFYLHDIGYIGKPNMDGPEGEKHPEFGAGIIRRLFGDNWGDFCLFHSRYYATANGRPFSRLAVADKFAICLTPPWIYLPLARMSGELKEYRANAARSEKKLARYGKLDTDLDWKLTVDAYMIAWVNEHRDLKADTWTTVRHVEK